MTQIHKPGDIIRQGDVFLVAIEKLPEEMTPLSPREDGKVVLALGEVTGHHHRIEGGTAIDYGFDREGNRGIRVTVQSPMIHEEHSAPPLIGDYLSHIQQEWVDEPIAVVD